MKKVVELNARAWDIQSSGGNSPWVQPVTAAEIAAARAGAWSVILTPTKPVPRAWFADLTDSALLALASGGGQQVPILSAAGARVTSFDNSAEQLAKDRAVAEREGLALFCEQGDMADLSRFADASFQTIFHPVSNVFAADVHAVWRECFRVLQPGGRLLAGFMNPHFYLFDHDDIERGGPLQVRFALPFADIEHLSDHAIEQRISEGGALEFSHSLEAQIGGQCEAGFDIVGLYEDRWSDTATPLNAYMPTSIATLAVKPG